MLISPFPSKFYHIIKIASNFFRHNYDTWFCLESALKRAKKRAISRLYNTSEPLQNRGSRVRVLPPLPITEVERLRFSFFLCFSVQKRFSIYFFNRFLNQHESTIVPFITLCATISVQYSIKKVSRASKEHQGDRRKRKSAVAFFFAYSDAIFEPL